LTKML